MSSESHNTRLSGMKQELHNFRNKFSTQLSDLSHSLNEKFDSLYKLEEDSLEEKIIELDISRNKLGHCTRRNNIKIQGIPATVSDDHLEHKVLDICKSINLTVENSDIEGCHRIGKSDPKTTIVRFVNRKFCNLILDKKHEVKKNWQCKIMFSKQFEIIC